MGMEQKHSGAARVMAILDVLGSVGPTKYPEGMTVSDVSRAMGREKSVISRQLKSLLETDLVARNSAGRYELSWRLFALALRAGDQRLTKAAGPVLFRLTEMVRERTYLTVLSDGKVLTVFSESSRRSIEAVGWVGRTVEVNRSSSGMALLLDHDDEHILDIARRREGGLSDREARAFLTHVREGRRRGYTLANRIFDPELIGIGAPVRDYSGRIIAAVNLSGPAPRIEAHIPVFAGHLLSAVQALQKNLGPAV
jgi:IclR family KDG regulon transcriptional repressor